MKWLVDDLFEYTTVRQTNTPLNVIRFDMVQLLEQLAIDFQIDADEMDMKLQVSSSVSKYLMEGDSEKLVRVFSNLLSNAFKYGKDGDIIAMELAPVDADSVRITIKNNGERIPDEALEQLFERFYRAETSRTQETASTGLGLAIAKGIVELHHGTITAKTNEKWTKFIIELPRNID